MNEAVSQAPVSGMWVVVYSKLKERGDYFRLLFMD
jgi:hypothetical protein